uniref:Uncharacterized protein n=1 Tax=Arundo donax TaxID=35708 RepID=A0A0A9GP79_ARUDO
MLSSNQIPAPFATKLRPVPCRTQHFLHQWA